MSVPVLVSQGVPLFPRLSEGRIGGKGCGLSRLAGILKREEFASEFPGLAISLPRTFILGTDSFERFMSRTGFRSAVSALGDWRSVRTAFLAMPLPDDLEIRLGSFLSEETRPLIVRSSSGYEDSGSAPFSGIYSSYIIPNSHPDPQRRLRQLKDAIRLVWAGVFSPDARSYCEEARLPPENEEMAVVIQELVGQRRGRWFYPRISGVAQSHNPYPVSYAAAKDGLCGLALGLGAWVVNGGVVHRFCPKYPALNAIPPERASEGSQHRFLALDMQKDEPDLLQGEDASLEELDLVEAEGTGALEWIVSTWDMDDQRLVPGTSVAGPRVIDFAPILKYDALPLAPALRRILTSCETEESGPVELEFAVDRDPGGGKETLFLLQVKPLAPPSDGDVVDLSSLTSENSLLISNQAMGHGSRAGVNDVVWISPDQFDRSKTSEMVSEIREFNDILIRQERPYILIGPGRWGTRDPWLGVPVTFSDISGAAVLVETQISGFSIDFSFGSHFLHNLINLRHGYIALDSGKPNYIDWEWLRSRQPSKRLTYASWIRLEGPLAVLIDGVNGLGTILKPLEPRDYSPRSPNTAASNR